VVPAGRPVDVEQLPDGSLLISDDEVGALYRVTYNASNANSNAGGSDRLLQIPSSRETSSAAVSLVPAVRATVLAAAVALLVVVSS
jgi:hypothetical protein